MQPERSEVQTRIEHAAVVDNLVCKWPCYVSSEFSTVHVLLKLKKKPVHRMEQQSVHISQRLAIAGFQSILEIMSKYCVQFNLS